MFYGIFKPTKKTTYLSKGGNISYYKPTGLYAGRPKLKSYSGAYRKARYRGFKLKTIENV